MKLIEPKVEQLIQKPGIEGMYEMIDRIAGICYGRHELHEDSRAFVEKLISMGHMRPLEFGTVYLYYAANPYSKEDEIFVQKYKNNPYSIVTYLGTDDSYDTKNSYGDALYSIVTNCRVIIENHWEEDLKCWKETLPYGLKHIERPCFLFTCSRAVADEFRTHITLSSMMKSTRYCKVNDLEICRPQWIKQHHGILTKDDLDKIIEGCDNPDYIPFDLYWWWYNMNQAEDMYKTLIQKGLKPQQARGVLPMDMATELCMCGFYINGDLNAGWNRFLKMRCDKSAHEDAQYLANQVKEILKNGKDL